jgi:hypothetical protein
MRSPCCLCVPLLFHFLCGPSCILGKYAISSSQNFLCILWDHLSVRVSALIFLLSLRSVSYEGGLWSNPNIFVFCAGRALSKGSRRLVVGFRVCVWRKGPVSGWVPARVTPCRGGVTSSQTPPPVGGPISKHVEVLKRIKIWSWVPTGPENKIDYAGEGQQQFTLPTDQ